MKFRDQIIEDAKDMDMIMSVCGAMPRGDELPQVAGIEDILMDVYSDVLNAPRDIAAARFHHQYGDDDFDYDTIIH